MADLQRLGCESPGCIAHAGGAVGPGHVCESTSRTLACLGYMHALTSHRFKSYDLQPPRHVRLLQMTDCEEIDVLLRFSRYSVTGWQ